MEFSGTPEGICGIEILTVEKNKILCASSTKRDGRSMNARNLKALSSSRVYPRLTYNESSIRSSRNRRWRRPYCWKKRDSVKKAIAAKPDSGSCTSLLNEIGPLVDEEDGGSMNRELKMGTMMASTTNVRHDMDFPVHEEWSRAHHFRLILKWRSSSKMLDFDLA